jgi:uncharacterized repeat protein (TIGR02543 family)
MRNKIASLFITSLIILSQFSIELLPVYATNYNFNNGLIRFDYSSPTAINTSTGFLNQPFYHSANNSWYKLTYSSYPLDYALAEGGDGTNEYNLNGQYNDTQNGLSLNSGTLTIDSSELISDNGLSYGKIVTSGVNTINGKSVQVTNTFELGLGNSFVKISTEIKNIESTYSLTNLRYWVGTRDDWVGNSDGPTKRKGNIVDGSFSQISTASDRASAIQITTANEGVLFYTTESTANMSVNYCCSFSNATNQDPSTSDITTSGDGSYAMFIRLRDLAPNESQTVVWYYAAGALADLASVVTQVASAASSFSNVSYSSATFSATSNVNATGYYVLVPENATAPTASQIVAAADYSGVSIVGSGNATMLANVASNFSLANLNVGGVYKIYFVTAYTDQNNQIQYSNISSATLTLVEYGSPLLSTTPSASNITTSTATLSGEVTSDNSEGTALVSDRGICYGTTSNPDSSNGTCVSLGSGTGTFSSSVTGLLPGRTYYVRAYGTNSYGTRYATQSSFTTASIPLSTSLNLTIPQIGATQPSTFSGTGYTATVSWNPAESDGIFHANQTYVATITLTPSTGYTLSGIAANSFTLNGASVVHNANSGTLTATYTSIAQKTLTYHSNGGSSISGGLINVGATISQPIDPTRIGYRFDGWYSDANYRDLFSFTGAVMPNMDLDLYAKWAIESYSISYDYAGGTGSNPSTYTINDAISFSTPIKEGYRFEGWSPISSISPGSTGNVSVAAQWTFVPRTPVIGGISVLNLGSDSASISANVVDYGNPKLNAFSYELTNLDTGNVTRVSLGAGLNANITGLNPYTQYAIKFIASNGVTTLTSSASTFMPKLLDSDNDGIPDVRDAFPEDSTKSFDVTEISPDSEPKRVLMGYVESSQTQEYQLKISEKDLMGLERSDNVLVIMGSVQFSIPVAMVDTILANTEGEDAWLTLKVEPQIVQETFNENILETEDMNLIAAYDYLLFQVYSDGTETPVHELGGKIKVGIGLNELQGEYDPNNMEVYFYDDEKGTIEAMKAVYDPATQSMIFLTEHFSYYVLGVKKEEDPANTTMQVLLLGIAIGMTIMGFIWFLFSRKKKDQRNA